MGVKEAYTPPPPVDYKNEAIARISEQADETTALSTERNMLLARGKPTLLTGGEGLLDDPKVIRKTLLGS
jgi:hypothetical protein